MAMTLRTPDLLNSSRFKKQKPMINVSTSGGGGGGGRKRG